MRNMMELGATFTPNNQEGLHNYYVKIEYEMFHEMTTSGEFDPKDYPETQFIKMKLGYNDDDQDEYDI